MLKTKTQWGMGNHPIPHPPTFLEEFLLPDELLGFRVVEVEKCLETKKSESKEGNKVKKRAAELWTLNVFEQRADLRVVDTDTGKVGWESPGEAKKEGKINLRSMGRASLVAQ